MYYPCSENKGTDQLHGNMHLICAFILAYAKGRFPNEAAHLYLDSYSFKHIFLVMTMMRRSKMNTRKTRLKLIIRDRLFSLKTGGMRGAEMRTTQKEGNKLRGTISPMTT